MSSNNEIVIIHKNKEFRVYVNPCVDNKFIPDRGGLIGKSFTIEGAIKIAKKYVSANVIEYGIRFL